MLIFELVIIILLYEIYLSLKNIFWTTKRKKNTKDLEHGCKKKLQTIDNNYNNNQTRQACQQQISDFSYNDLMILLCDSYYH